MNAAISSANNGVKYFADVKTALMLFLGWFQLIFGNASFNSSKGMLFRLLEVGRITGSVPQLQTKLHGRSSSGAVSPLCLCRCAPV